MRLFFAGIETETNTFSPIPIGIEAFESYELLRGDEILDPERGHSMALYARSLGLDVVGGLYASAHPGAPVNRAAYEQLRDELLARLEHAHREQPIDIVALCMHGGMIAYGYDDCEGDIITRIRHVVGSEVVVGCELDPHSHLSTEMHTQAVLMCYRENPHIDISARGRELVDLLIRTARSEVSPVTSVFNCRMADVFQTLWEPMKSFVDRMKQIERDVQGVLSISVVHGFRRADIPLMGAHVLVITDNAPELGQQIAERLGLELFAGRGTWADPITSLESAVAQARDWDRPRMGKPLILADLADNPGGGSPGDATYVLEALLSAGVENMAVGILVDPLAVRDASAAGVGAKLNLRIGGKACALSGRPLDLDVEVIGVDAAATIKLDGGTTVPMGRAVALRFASGVLVLAEQRNQTYGPSLFAEFGIDLSACNVILVKSAQHYKPHFMPISEHSIVVDAPGVCVGDVQKLSFTRRSKPMWPWESDPWAVP
ncbi:MAG: M81 family metallopeptidase [Limnohabitans sp.]